MEMRPSTTRTMTVPGTPTTSPALLAIAADDRPMRVVLVNVGASPLRLAFTSSALGGLTSEGVDHFLLTTGREITMSLAPKQKLFAVSVGATGTASVHASDALPFSTPIPGAL